tara:strand:- start:452 stop:652 length:201 start_codon:yes stop_codon:yes gene_type:complete
VAHVQVGGCLTLAIVCGRSDDAAALDRRRLATQTGGRTVVIAGMLMHPDDGLVQRYGQHLLDVLPQ